MEAHRMIKQTDSTLASIRGWGCYFCSLLFMYSESKRVKMNIGGAERIFDLCKASGIILDNDIPTSKPGWYRSFVAVPLRVFEIADVWGGTKTKARETYRDKVLTDTPAGFFSVIEYRTRSGSHFCVGRIEDGEAFILYNPDPRITGTEIRTVRHWEVK
jgi:hypothetical protein